MATLTNKKLNDLIQYSSFSTEAGCEEVFITLRTRPHVDFVSGLQSLADDYATVLQQAELSDTTTVFSRIFASDLANQKEKLDSSAIFKRLKNGAISIIEQKPVGSGPLSLFSYHLRNMGHPAAVSQSMYASEKYGNTNSYKGKNYSLLFTANYTSSTAFDAYCQTAEIFKDLSATLERNSMRLIDNTIRTWIYVRDIDNHYQNMVRARREFFTEHGLANTTRYLASTGIEGGSHSPERIVSVDSLSIGGLLPGQIVRMEAPTHLSPTIVYGVTFERGLRVRFGDRSHLYISGTASINNKGEVLYIGDVAAQTRRTVENLRALLAAQQASLKDLTYLLVYIRNFHEWERVQGVLREEIGDRVPFIAIESKVCRPAWLFELEGMAIIADKNEFPSFL